MTTKGKMSKREIQYELKRIHEERIEEIKTRATAEWEAKIKEERAKLEQDITRIKQKQDSEKLQKEWAAVTKGTHNWIAMEKWLQNQSDILKKRAEIKKELMQEINEQ